MDILCHLRYPDILQGLMDDTQSSGLLAAIEMESEVDDIMSWSRKHPEVWSSGDIINWIYSVAVSLDMSLDKLRGERFQDLTGQQLCQLQISEFMDRDPVNGAQLFTCLRQLLRRSQFIHPTDFSDMDDYMDDIDGLYRYAECQKLDIEKWESGSSSVQPFPSISVFLDPMNKLPFDDIGPIDDGYALPLPACLSPYQCDIDYKNCIQDLGYESGESLSETSVRRFQTLNSPLRSFIPPAVKHLPINCSINEYESLVPSSSGDRVVLTPVASDVTAVTKSDRPLKRKPGRPPKRLTSCSSSSSSTDENTCPTISKKSKKRSTHLWQFMRALLDDPTCNPSYIKWENKKEGVFRIVPGQSKVIAQLWGKRKNNPSMTFDKMSRSLRWCRSYGFLSEVPKNGNYPKKLCFRFGERASDWQTQI